MLRKKTKIDSDNFASYMNENKLNTCTQNKKLKREWTDKKKYFIHYRMLRFHFKHALIVDKNHEIISFK